MKKLISIVLAVMTLMGLMIPVFAGAEGNIRYVNCEDGKRLNVRETPNGKLAYRIACGTEVEIIFANRPATILHYTDTVITCDIHTRARTKRILRKAGARIVLGLDDILNALMYGLYIVFAIVPSDNKCDLERHAHVPGIHY